MRKSLYFPAYKTLIDAISNADGLATSVTSRPEAPTAAFQGGRSAAAQESIIGSKRREGLQPCRASSICSSGVRMGRSRTGASSTASRTRRCAYAFWPAKPITNALPSVRTPMSSWRVSCRSPRTASAFFRSHTTHICSRSERSYCVAGVIALTQRSATRLPKPCFADIPPTTSFSSATPLRNTTGCRW